MKILVTGPTGFIGRYVTANLLKRERYQVVATSLNHDKAQKFDWCHGIQYIPCNLHRSGVDFYNLFYQPDVLVHLAWPGLPNYNQRFHFEENLPADYAFVKKMVASGLKRLIITGTCFEYGSQNGCLGEEALAQPATNYALAKDTLRKFMEALLVDYPEVSFAWLRLFYMFGPGQNPNSLLGQLERAVQNGDKTFNLSGGEQLRDYLPVEKIAVYIARLATIKEAQGVINVCSGRPISVRRLVEDWVAARAVSLELNWGHYPYAKYEPMAYWGNNRKLLNLLGESSTSSGA